MNEGCNFENDALADGKPMKLIPENRRDVIEFPCVRDQPGRRVENGLQLSQDRRKRRRRRRREIERERERERDREREG